MAFYKKEKFRTKPSFVQWHKSHWGFGGHEQMKIIVLWLLPLVLAGYLAYFVFA